MSRKKVSEIKWCTYCGAQAPSGAAFCPRCGEPIDPNYVYDERITSGDEIVEEAEETEKGEEITSIPIISSAPSGKGTQVLYEGMIRGLVTNESRARVVNHYIPSIGDYTITEVCFTMKLEEKIGIVEIPDEILVQTSKFGYFGIDDKVILQGTILKDLNQWGRPMYFIRAKHFYNESLQIGDE